MLYIVFAYLMLFAALSNAVCLYNASFFPFISANVSFFPFISANSFCFHALSWSIVTILVYFMC